MPSAAGLRDSTQIVLPEGMLETVREELETEFTLTFHSDGELVRIIGSPIEIKHASEFLSRHGVRLP